LLKKVVEEVFPEPDEEVQEGYGEQKIFFSRFLKNHLGEDKGGNVLPGFGVQDLNLMVRADGPGYVFEVDITALGRIVEASVAVFFIEELFCHKRFPYIQDVFKP